jgi:hypothetical protein
MIKLTVDKNTSNRVAYLIFAIFVRDILQLIIQLSGLQKITNHEFFIYRINFEFYNFREHPRNSWFDDSWMISEIKTSVMQSLKISALIYNFYHIFQIISTLKRNACFFKWLRRGSKSRNVTIYRMNDFLTDNIRRLTEICFRFLRTL